MVTVAVITRKCEECGENFQFPKNKSNVPRRFCDKCASARAKASRRQSNALAQKRVSGKDDKINASSRALGRLMVDDKPTGSIDQLDKFLTDLQKFTL
jgi:hypothetical protein